MILGQRAQQKCRTATPLIKVVQVDVDVSTAVFIAKACVGPLARKEPSCQSQAPSREESRSCQGFDHCYFTINLNLI